MTAPLAHLDAHEYTGTVTYVVDGDTCDVLVELGFDIRITVRFRWARIDTPERGQPGFEEAKQFLINKFSTNPIVSMRSIKRGKFRYVAEFYQDNLNLNDELLSLGLAKPYV